MPTWDFCGALAAWFLFQAPGACASCWLATSKDVSCSTAGCQVSATFDYYNFSAPFLSITNLFGDFGSSSEYADVYVNGMSTSMECSASTDCGTPETCVENYNLTSYVSSSNVTITLDATSSVNVCFRTKAMSATITVTQATQGTCAPTSMPSSAPTMLPSPAPSAPTILPNPAPTPLPIPQPTPAPTTTTMVSMAVAANFVASAVPTAADTSAMKVAIADALEVDQGAMASFTLTASSRRLSNLESAYSFRRLTSVWWSVSFVLYYDVGVPSAEYTDKPSFEKSFQEILVSDAFQATVISQVGATLDVASVTVGSFNDRLMPVAAPSPSPSWLPTLPSLEEPAVTCTGMFMELYDGTSAPWTWVILFGGIGLGLLLGKMIEYIFCKNKTEEKGKDAVEVVVAQDQEKGASESIIEANQETDSVKKAINPQRSMSLDQTAERRPAAPSSRYFGGSPTHGGKSRFEAFEDRFQNKKPFGGPDRSAAKKKTFLARRSSSSSGDNFNLQYMGNRAEVL